MNRADVIQIGLVALFALNAGLVEVVQAALVGSVIANGVLVLGIAFLAGGLRNGRQTFNSSRARLIATLTMLAAAILAVPTFHTPAAPHGRTLSLISAGVLIVLFFVTLPAFLTTIETVEAAPPLVRATGSSRRSRRPPKRCT